MPTVATRWPSPASRKSSERIRPHRSERSRFQRTPQLRPAAPNEPPAFFAWSIEHRAESRGATLASAVCQCRARGRSRAPILLLIVLVLVIEFLIIIFIVILIGYFPIPTHLDREPTQFQIVTFWTTLRRGRQARCISRHRGRKSPNEPKRSRSEKPSPQQRPQFAAHSAPHTLYPRGRSTVAKIKRGCCHGDAFSAADRGQERERPLAIAGSAVKSKASADESPFAPAKVARATRFVAFRSRESCGGPSPE